MELTIHTIDSAPAGSRELLAGIASDLGFVPNLAGSVAASPVLLAAFDGLRRSVGSGRLEPVHREVAGLATGVAVDNGYGVAFHSTVLARLGVDQPELDKMRAGDPPADPRCAAIYELAREIVRNRGRLEDAVVARATAAGFTAPDLLEVVAECTFAGLVGMVDNLAGRVELDGFLAAQAWHR